jgi:hypothetical protein
MSSRFTDPVRSEHSNVSLATNLNNAHRHLKRPAESAKLRYREFHQSSP